MSWYKETIKEYEQLRIEQQEKFITAMLSERKTNPLNIEIISKKK